MIVSLTMRLKGKRALISGGGSGIGQATALLFAGEGAIVTICGRDEDKLSATARMLRDAGGICHTMPGDISIAADCNNIADFADKSMDGIDILFNNAGIYRFGNVSDTEEQTWDYIFDINLKGCQLLSKTVIPRMNRGAVILNNASSLGIKPVPNTAAYSASKAAMISLTKSMALELAGQGIRANCICPAVVRTPIHGKNNEKLMKDMAKLHPLGVVGEAEDIAYAALFLASDEARWITGITLPVDGGISCT